MKTVVDKALKKAGDETPLKKVTRVGGGSISASYFAETHQGRYFVKYHPNAPARFFELEAKGLDLISQTDSIAVPDVCAYSDESGGAFLVMEWIEGTPSADTQRQLGDRVAKMHQSFGDKHGLDVDTFIGTLPQPNGLFSSWLAYYRDQRLGAQLQLGIDRGRITGERRHRMETLLENLGKWVPDDTAPSSLHGDLWGGNWLVGSGGIPYVIDPSFLYGDRHFELAFTELFGGYSNDFYRAYEERFPLSPDYDDIKPLYQLYYLLVHLISFGEGYGPPVDAILKRYCG
ncbi:fructosamine kinase family protein [Lentibacillus halophilus]|uniref:Fructosamine kinase family protein n=1 Tax=Lentibacillus halophilus TaxID=295065 RepID=A0ABP3IZQ2_9BACI